MANSLKLTQSSITGSSGIKLLNGDFTYGWKNLTSEDPVEGGYGAVEPVMVGWENPQISLTFHIPNDGSLNDGTNYLNWAVWNQLAKNTLGSLYLSVSTGASDAAFVDYSDSTGTTGRSSIPVQIKSYNLRFAPSDSRNSYFWTINAQLSVVK